MGEIGEPQTSQFTWKDSILDHEEIDLLMSCSLAATTTGSGNYLALLW